MFRGAILALAALTLPAAAAEHSVTLATPSGQLAGTLALPENVKAALLILPGSGPDDRDGNALALGVKAADYRLLAQGLAAKGIASLRIDKRGIGESAPAMTAEADLRIGIYADDARAWAAELRKRTGQGCVWLLGHSEGALVAELAAQNPNGICGLVLASGPGRDMGDFIITQAQNTPPQARQKISEIVASLRQGKAVADVPPSLTALFRPGVQPYWISEINLDPATLLKGIGLPVMILQGDNDIQVPVSDAKLLAAAKPGARLVILPGVNHVLKNAPTDRSGNIATYADPDLPLAPGVVDDIAGFVQNQK